MADITTIQNILAKAKAGQWVTIKASSGTDYTAKVVSLDTSNFGAVAAEDWTEGWPAPSEEPDPEDTSDWGRLVSALEGCSASDFDMENLTYSGSNETIKSKLVTANPLIRYKVYQAQDAVDTTWIPLGFNASVPEYVKYRRAVGSGWKHVWVKSVKNGLLAAIAEGDPVYTREYDSSALDNTYTAVDGETVTGFEGSFTYGNNHGTDASGNVYDARWTVPAKITTAKGTYDFCGYNVTLNSQAVLNIEGINTLIWSGVVNSSGTNDWSQATLRKWLNSSAGVAGMYFNNTTEHADYLGLMSRLNNEEGFMKNVAKCVNRTWVHGSYTSGKTLDGNQCEHIVDKFWLPGNGNVNCTNNTDFNDHLHDTFRCSLITEDTTHESNDSRIRYNMNTDGSTSSSAGYWWLRSASAGISMFGGGICAGVVYGNGLVSDALVFDAINCGASPACLIG